MTSLYLDVDGDDSKDGLSAATAVKSVRRINWQHADGDVIYCNGSTLSNPHRGELKLRDNVTVRPLTAGESIYMTSAQRIDEDSALPYSSYSATFAGGIVGGNTDDGTAIDGSGGGWGAIAGTPAHNTSEQLYGTGCLELPANAAIRKGAGSAFREMDVRISLVYKCAATGQIAMRIDQPAVEDGLRHSYNFGDPADADGTTPGWGTEGTHLVPGATETSWATVSTPWMNQNDAVLAGGTASASIWFYVYAKVATCYIQEVIFEYRVNWAESSEAGTYQAPFVFGNEYAPDVTYAGPGGLSGLYFTTNESDRTAYRMSIDVDPNPATKIVPTLSDLESHTDNTWDEGIFADGWADRGGGLMYFRPASGLALSDYSLYLAQGKAGIQVTIDGKDIIIENHVSIMDQRAIYSTKTGTLKAYNCRDYLSVVGGYQFTGNSDVELHGFKSIMPIVSDISKRYGGGTLQGNGNLIQKGGYVQWAGDDAYQNNGQAVIDGKGALDMDGCSDYQCFGYGIEPNVGGMASGTIGTAKIKRHTSIEGGHNSPITGGAFRAQGAVAETFEFEDVVFIEADGMNAVSFANAAHDAVVTGKFYSQTVASGDGTGDAQANINAVRIDRTAAELGLTGIVPSADSELVGAGTKSWGNGPRPTSSTGEPYPDTKQDVGGVQTTYDLNHPNNL